MEHRLYCRRVESAHSFVRYTETKKSVAVFCGVVFKRATVGNTAGTDTVPCYNYNRSQL